MRVALSQTKVRVGLVIVVVAIAAAVGVVLATASNGKAPKTPLAGASAPIAGVAAPNAASLPLAPLSSLGKLTPAPSPGKPGPEGVAIPITKYVLANPQDVHLHETIDGITCERLENVTYHVHAHLTLFVDGKAYGVPLGIGIGQKWEGVNTADGPFVEAGSCFMWLHTHAYDGIIHIESPTPTIYTLGQFFAVWGQPLSKTRLGPYRGKVTTFYDGQVWTGNPSDIPLTSTTQIQLDAGTPIIAPEHIVFPAGLLPSTSIAPRTTTT
jgi:hypothetical protein